LTKAEKGGEDGDGGDLSLRAIAEVHHRPNDEGISAGVLGTEIPREVGGGFHPFEGYSYSTPLGIKVAGKARR
jgi:hypothetical protein